MEKKQYDFICGELKTIKIMLGNLLGRKYDSPKEEKEETNSSPNEKEA